MTDRSQLKKPESGKIPLREKARTKTPAAKTAEDKSIAVDDLNASNDE